MLAYSTIRRRIDAKVTFFVRVLADNKDKYHDDNCAQCGAHLEPSFSFCPNCGQKRITKGEKVGDIIKSFLGDYLAYDSKLALSLKPLLFRPGFLTSEYLSGKRTKYIPPLRLYIFISLIFFLILNWHSNLDYQSESEERFWDFFFGDYLPKIFFFLLPLFAALLGLVFRKKHQGYVANLILSLHFHSFTFLTLSVYLLLSRWLAAYDFYFANNILLSLFGIWAMANLFLSLKRVMNVSFLAVLWRFILFLLLYGATVLLVVLGVLAIFTLTG